MQARHHGSLALGDASFQLQRRKIGTFIVGLPPQRLWDDLVGCQWEPCAPIRTTSPTRLHLEQRRRNLTQKWQIAQLTAVLSIFAGNTALDCRDTAQAMVTEDKSCQIITVLATPLSLIVMSNTTSKSARKVQEKCMSFLEGDTAVPAAEPVSTQDRPIVWRDKGSVAWL